jgi:glycosyltransferase involved in cell wall biosynthesis
LHPLSHPAPVRSLAVEPRVSVVAPSYQRRHALPGFVEPLLRDAALHELVIALDGSTDGSGEWLRERARDDPRIVVLELPNRGAGPTRQSGVERATGDVVLLMDDDVIASEGLVSGHARHHRDGARRLVLGYMPNDWRVLPVGRRGIARIYREAYESHCARYAVDPDHVLLGLWGGNLSMRREEFLNVTPVTEMALPRGQDDREWGLRLHKAGVRGCFDPELLARHEYDRPLAAFRRDCRINGATRRLLHELHADLVGPELKDTPEGSHVPDAPGRRVPARLRRALPLLAGDPIFGAVTALLTAVFWIGVRARALPIEVFAARGIGSLETQRGVLHPDLR